jgi:hypothetical protein
VIRTKPEPWAYAAEYPLPDKLRREAGSSPFYLSIRARATAGDVGLLLVDQPQTGVLDQVTIPATNRVTEVLLSVANPAQASSIIVRTMGTGQAAILEVESIKAILVDKIKPR